MNVPHHDSDILSTLEWEYTFPAIVEPAWSHKVDRWYQLDAFAYGLAEFWYMHSQLLGPSPSMVVLASPAASNEADYRFASSGACNARLFVHTLPSVRVSALCQVMQWNGPVLYVQDDSNTMQAAVREARSMLGPDYPRIWAIGAAYRPDRDRYLVRCTVVAQVNQVTQAKQAEQTKQSRSVP